MTQFRGILDVFSPLPLSILPKYTLSMSFLRPPWGRKKPHKNAQDSWETLVSGQAWDPTSISFTRRLVNYASSHVRYISRQDTIFSRDFVYSTVQMCCPRSSKLLAFPFIHWFLRSISRFFARLVKHPCNNVRIRLNFKSLHLKPDCTIINRSLHSRR